MARQNENIVIFKKSAHLQDTCNTTGSYMQMRCEDYIQHLSKSLHSKTAGSNKVRTDLEIAIRLSKFNLIISVALFLH